MNFRRVLHILGLLLLVLAGAQLIPIASCLANGEQRAVIAFLSGAVATALLGGLLRIIGHREGELYRREGVLIVVGAWALASLTGAIPYMLSGAIPHPVDALFESASGFTTTGASILVDIEAAGRGVLFWRSFTQWLGGIGIVVLFVALLSELGPGARFLFKLEVPGPKAEVLHERVRETALALFRIYAALSVVEFALLMLCGLDLYDALTHTFSTVSTGGFSPYAESVGRYSASVQVVVTLFMVAAGVNFSLYYAFSRSRSALVLRDVELRFYGGLLAAAALVIYFDVYGRSFDGVTVSLLDVCFQVVSVLTTTGFATANFDSWPDFSRVLLVALMFIGGSAGSTAGGAKIVRLIVGWKATMRDVRLTFSPRSVIAVVVGGQPVPEASVRSVVSFLVLWFLTWAVGALLLSIGDTEVLTAATASIATLANIGPGLAGVGPTENFAFFAAWQKLVMVILMWLGRLELFAVLALAQPQFWRH
jgi:trk system potassium uptake protein TrkH